MKATVRVADEGSQVELARDKVSQARVIAVWMCNCRGSNSVLTPPQ